MHQHHSWTLCPDLHESFFFILFVWHLFWSWINSFSHPRCLLCALWYLGNWLRAYHSHVQRCQHSCIMIAFFNNTCILEVYICSFEVIIYNSTYVFKQQINIVDTCSRKQYSCPLVLLVEHLMCSSMVEDARFDKIWLLCLCVLLGWMIGRCWWIQFWHEQIWHLCHLYCYSINRWIKWLKMPCILGLYVSDVLLMFGWKNQSGWWVVIQQSNHPKYTKLHPFTTGTVIHILNLKKFITFQLNR